MRILGILVVMVATGAYAARLPEDYHISAYNGYSITFSCYYEEPGMMLFCAPGAAELLQIQKEAERICGRGKTAELGGSWSQYGATNLLFLCLPN